MSIASSVGIARSPQYATYGVHKVTDPKYMLPDVGLTQGRIADAYSNAAENSLNQMINAAKGAISNVGSGNAALQEAVNGHITNMNTQGDKMSAVADNIGKQAGVVSDYAGQISNVAQSLTPYAQAMKDYANSVYGQGQTLVDQGNQLLGTWSNFAPLVGKYTSALGSLDPNNQVSMAAHDVQNSFQNTQGQNARALSRMGVDPSSGAFQAQKAQWDQALATALSGAKTRARNKGLQEQITALAQGLGVGSGLAQAGAQIGGQGTNAMTQAGDLLGGAANILNQQGGLLGTAGQMESTAGSLMNAQAGVYQNVGSLQQAAGQLALNLGATTQEQTLKAQSLLQDALGSAASYYNSQAAGWAALAGGGNLVKSMDYFW